MRILIQVRQGKWNSGNFQGKISKAAVELRKVSWILLFNDLPPLYCHLKMIFQGIFLLKINESSPKKVPIARNHVYQGQKRDGWSFATVICWGKIQPSGGS